ncbi:MAG: ABC transporter ATP-binding protein [Thermoplasmata archaeon]|nr:MAG: ABC transporter ATP-binding protein [Thermoplasmata archaeon]
MEKTKSMRLPSVSEKEPNYNNSSLVILDKISKSYRGYKVLNSVSFHIDKGDVMGYIGPNGAGKTTTIRILVGLLRKFEGRLQIKGIPVPARIEELNGMIGYLPQHVSFQRWRTVDHALKTFGRLSGLDEDILEERIRKVLNQVHLSDVRHKKIVHLSGGMIQILGLAQAILHNPKFLVLDEPMAGLDPENRYKVKQIIRELNRNGTTVLFSSHILSDVQDITTKIAVLNRGQIMHIGSMDTLRTKLHSTNDIDIVLSGKFKQTQDLTKIAGVKGVEYPQPNKLLIHLEDQVNLDEVSRDIQRLLMADGYSIRSFTPYVPNLEELYIRFINGGGNQ